MNQDIENVVRGSVISEHRLQQRENHVARKSKVLWNGFIKVKGIYCQDVHAMQDDPVVRDEIVIERRQVGDHRGGSNEQFALPHAANYNELLSSGRVR
jgi:hypothetical protein